MASSVTAVKGIDSEKPQDVFDFSPPLGLGASSAIRNKDYSRLRLSKAGIEPTTQTQTQQPGWGCEQQSEVLEETEQEPRCTKRRQGASKSFSSIRPGNLHSFRASYQAVKANAKQCLHTVTLSKRRAASHESGAQPMLQRRRSLFGLRPSTAADTSSTTTDKPFFGSPPATLQSNVPPTTSALQFSGAAARQSARDYGKVDSSSRPRDDSAFGEHRRRCEDNRESGISLTADFENLQLDVPDVSRHDPTERLPTELCSLIFSYVEMRDLARLERVSPRWRSLTRDPCVRRLKFMKSWAPLNSIDALPSVVGGTGVGLSRTLDQDWTRMYRIREELAQRWRDGPHSPDITATYLNGHTDSVYCVQFDETKIITGSRDRTFRVWDVQSGELRLTVGIPRASENDRRNGPRIGTQESLAGPMRVINQPANTQCQYLTPRAFHDASILCLQFDDEILVTGSSDHSLIVWNVKTFQPIRRLLHHTAGVLDIAFDKAKIVSCSKDGSICVWDRINGRLLTVLTGHRGPVNAVQMRGDLIVTASGEGCARLWQLVEHDLGTDTGSVEGRFIKEFKSKDRGLACVEFSADGRFVMAGGNDKVIYKFDAKSAARVEIYKGHKGLVRSLYLDQSNNRIVTGSYDHELKCWDFENEKVSGIGAGIGVERWGLSKWATSWILSAKSDYRRLITTSQDGRALLLDFGSGIEGVDMLKG